jgi:hypothetical protein
MPYGLFFVNKVAFTKSETKVGASQPRDSKVKMLTNPEKRGEMGMNPERDGLFSALHRKDGAPGAPGETNEEVSPAPRKTRTPAGIDTYPY